MTSTAVAAFTDRYAESYRPAQISTFVLYNAHVDAEAKKNNNNNKKASLHALTQSSAPG